MPHAPKLSVEGCDRPVHGACTRQLASNPPGLAPASVNQKLSAIRKLASEAVYAGWLDAAVAQGIKRSERRQTTRGPGRELAYQTGSEPDGRFRRCRCYQQKTRCKVFSSRTTAAPSFLSSDRRADLMDAVRFASAVRRF